MDWAHGVGAYCLAKDAEGGLIVTHRGTGNATKVPLDATSGSTDFSEWRIEGNWQEQLAKLTNGTISILLHQISLQTPLQVRRANESCTPGKFTPPKSQKAKADKQAATSPDSPLEPHCLLGAFASAA